MHVKRCCVVLAAAGFAAGAVGCVDILGLDHGVPEEPDGSAEAGDPEVSPTEADASVDHASAREDAAIGADAGRDGSGDPTTDAARAPDATAPDGPSEPDSGCAYTVCPSGCVDTVTDPRHCGSCTEACPYGAHSAATCTGGVCGQVCDQGYVDCAGQNCSCGGGNVCLSDGTCGACRPALQACHLGSDCCSGTCGASLTCL